MAGSPRVERRASRWCSTAAGLAGATGVPVTSPAKPRAPKETEVLVGVSKTAGSLRTAREADAPGDARVVYERGTLDAVAVTSITEAPDRASEHATSTLTQPTVQVSPPEPTSETRRHR